MWNTLNFRDVVMKEAEKMLYEEFAYVLNIRKEVLPFILQQVQVAEKK